MLNNNGRVVLASLRYFHEVLFSLNIAFLGVSLLFLSASDLQIPFTHLEVRINLFLHIRQTDFIRGYFEYSIAAGILAFFVWMLLRLSSATNLTQEFLRSTSGVVLLISPLVYWVWHYQVVGWPFGWPFRGAPIELLVVGFCLTLYLLGKWTMPGWVGVLVLAGHYFFWYWMPSTNPGLADYAGPIAPILGFCATLVWGFYLYVYRKTEVRLS